MTTCFAYPSSFCSSGLSLDSSFYYSQIAPTTAPDSGIPLHYPLLALSHLIPVILPSVKRKRDDSDDHLACSAATELEEVVLPKRRRHSPHVNGESGHLSVEPKRSARHLPQRTSRNRLPSISPVTHESPIALDSPMDVEPPSPSVPNDTHTAFAADPPHVIPPHPHPDTPATRTSRTANPKTSRQSLFRKRMLAAAIHLPCIGEECELP